MLPSSLIGRAPGFELGGCMFDSCLGSHTIMDILYGLGVVIGIPLMLGTIGYFGLRFLNREKI